MKKNKTQNIEHDIEKIIDSILRRKMHGVKSSINKMILDSLNQSHNRRVNEFTKSILPDSTSILGSSTYQEVSKMGAAINKFFLRDL